MVPLVCMKAGTGRAHIVLQTPCTRYQQQAVVLLLGAILQGKGGPRVRKGEVTRVDTRVDGGSRSQSTMGDEASIPPRWDLPLRTEARSKCIDQCYGGFVELVCGFLRVSSPAGDSN